MSESWLAFLINNLPELIHKIYEQLFLAGTGIVLAILISVPLGVWISKNARIRGPMLAAINILQTIPSLAVLAFLIPFVGIGAKPAIITLTVYALLPIVRNTTTGILNISQVLTEAADSLGLTRWQRLHKIDMPLAFPVIMVGIRTATTLCVGTATLAAFVGGGGLGDFIYQGLSLNNNRLILLGAIPAALLVLLLDFILAQIETSLVRQKKAPSKINKSFKFATVTVLVALFLIKPLTFCWAACQHNVVRIGARHEAEQLVLGEIMAQLLESKTQLKVIRNFNFVSPAMANEAIINKQVDIIPEYTGTAYMVTLKGDLLHRPHDFFEYIDQQYQKKYGIKWLSSFGFSNNNSVAISRQLAQQFHLRTISDLKPYVSEWKIAVPSDFFLRDDGYKGLHERYGLSFADVKLMEIGLMYSAIRNHQVQITMASTTDERLQGAHMMILQDDKHVFPDYSAAPIIRQCFLKYHPEIIPALQAVFGKISEGDIKEMNYAVNVQKKSVSNVVSKFLSSLKS